jgi:hypothetical protein
MAKSIGDLLKKFWAGQLSDKAPREAQIEEVWVRVAGPEVAAATQALRLTKHGLAVVIKDPLVREEVRYRAAALAEALQAAGFPEIHKVTVRG